MEIKNSLDYYTDVMKAMSDSTRLKIIWLLCNIDSKICSSEITEVLGENQYNISRHIKVLKNAGMMVDEVQRCRQCLERRKDRKD